MISAAIRVGEAITAAAGAVNIAFGVPRVGPVHSNPSRGKSTHDITGLPDNL
jgi:hypothetical protein